MRKVVALVVVFIVIFWSYYPNRDKYLNYEVMNENQLNGYVKEFYNGSVLDYGHRNSLPNTKLMKELPKEILIDVQGKILSLDEYRSLKKKTFFKSHSLGSKLKENEKRRVLESLPSPEMLNKQINVGKILIKRQLDKLKRKARNNGDDDLVNLPYLKSYLNYKKQDFLVPNLVHFIWFSCHDFKITDYMCLLAALRYQQPDFILVHGDCEPKGQYWRWLKEEAGGKLKFVKKTPPGEIFGNKIEDVEHQSDVARLEILLQVGGIYLDTDTMVLKSLDDLRNREEIVLGEYTEELLGNAAILANKESKFLKKWFLEYRTFSTEKHWLKSSMIAPHDLWREYPDSIHIVKNNMMRPNLDEMDFFFNGFIDWSNFWTIHLSPRFMEYKDLHRTIAQLAVLQSSYGEVSRHALWGESAIKDVTPWVLHPDFNKKSLA